MWSVGYPGELVRAYPRKGFDGEGKFYSLGYIKGENAYKKHAIYLARYNQCYDETVSKVPFGLHEINFKRLWAKYLNEPDQKKMKIVYLGYKNSGAPILYNTTDSGHGSSGGGVLAEKDGALIGIVVMGAGIGHAETAYQGISYLYRIDSICSQSNVMSKMEKCKKLLNKY